MKPTTITARICGSDHACAIPRDTLHLFEAVHGSANALMARSRAGAWTAGEIAAIIDFAIAPPKAAASLEATMLRTETVLEWPDVVGEKIDPRRAA